MCAVVLILILTIFKYSTSLESTIKPNGTYTDTCGGVFTAPDFFLQSPNYPQHYPANLSCVYVLKGPNCPTYFKFDFIDFDLDTAVGCVKDRLLIGNGEVLCGKVKGTKGYFNSNGSLNVKFSTENNGKGFKILVSRLPCKYNGSVEETTMKGKETIVPTTMKSQSTTQSLQPFHLPLPNQETEKNSPQCCLNTFASRRFLITSPNFPYSLNTRNECVIRIQKSDQNICRLRFSFLYFWLGAYNYNNCPYGYLRIDGKFICGCNKELNLVTSFENEDFKELVFRSEGTNLSGQSGFVVEVVQDECPSKYYPTSKFNLTTDNRLTVDGSITDDYIERAQLFTEKTNILNSSDNQRIIKSFYYFKENTSPLFSNETEPTTYIDTSTVSVIVTNTNQLVCTAWNQAQIINLFRKYGGNLQTCKKTENCIYRNVQITKRSNCVELGYLRGYFRSPNYPFFYPRLLNMCFRFRKQQGYCAIRLYMTDFQLENSYNCQKDYVLLKNQYRYCGKSLLGKYITFDLASKSYEDLIFVSDFFYCGRGFYGVYEQLPCQTPTIPIYPRTSTTFRPSSPTPNGICDRYIPDQLFILEVNENEQKCTYEIRKFSERVCKLVLHLEKFDLFCGSESLLVNNKVLCGHLSGRKISVNFDNYNEVITIVYQSNLSNKYEDFKFKISGEQVTDDCLIPEPPAQLNLLNVTTKNNYQ